MRTVCGLDIHKDSIFMCILDEQGKKSEGKFGVSTREIKELSASCTYMVDNYPVLQTDSGREIPFEHEQDKSSKRKYNKSRITS
ncbi:hypothetical protein [Proteiniphilum sp.]|uniref:hypothetical protein n=1 Tax=Proteiniphilum sp. TaxID=1926877 RepID=UPI00331FB8D3